MGASIDLYSYDYNKLVTKTMNVCKTTNKELIERVLLSCGNKIENRYIILDQDFWEDSNCRSNLARVLERLFKVDDAYSDIFFLDNDIDEQELIQAIEINEIEDKLQMDLSEEGSE